jgi:YfiH family protein
VTPDALLTGTPPLVVAVPEDATVRAAFSRRAADQQQAAADNVSLLVGERPGAARPRLAAAVGLRPEDVVYAQQVHGPGVAVVGTGDRGRGAHDAADALRDVDALVTFEEGVGVAVLAADCVPLLLVDPGRGVAAVHAGRTGLHAGVIPAALGVLLHGEAGAADRVVALVGPAIGPCCYEVPEGLREEVAAARPATWSTTQWGTPSLDVGAGAVGDLEAAGVGRIERIAECTACGHAQQWFSARAAAAGATTLWSSAPTGRHAGIVCRLPGPFPSA